MVLSAVLTVVALEVYRRRQLERAGDLVTVGWVWPVFQYGLGICGGVALGLILYMNFFDEFGPWVFIVLTLIAAVMCAFAGRMLLKKTLRVFADGWKGCAILAGALFLLLAGARLDLLGYQIWTPAADDVQEVSLSGVNSVPYDGGSYANYRITNPEEIAAVVDLHASVVRRLEDLEQSGASDNYNEDAYETETSTTLRLNYTMKDGRTVSRRYDMPICAAALTDPESYAAKLQALINRPELIRTAYWNGLPSGQLPEGMEVSGGYISNTRGAKEDSGRHDSYDLNIQEAQVLWQAVLEDLDTGRLGRRYLLDDLERQENCFISDIDFYLTWPSVGEDGEKEVNSTDILFTPQVTSTSTLKALEDLGLRQMVRSRQEG